MNELITVNENTMTVSARELHEKLQIETPYHKWFPRMCEYGFTEGTDFWTKMSESTGGRPASDSEVTIDMAKEICMIQRSEIGKQIRQYFIALEKAWNSPEQIMSRALKLADQNIAKLTMKNAALLEQVEEMKPKAEFFDAVTDSKDALEMKDVVKVLGVPGLGRNKLFDFLRREKILMSNNTPYQEYVDRGYFRVIEQKYDRGYGEIGINIKTLVFQKGVNYIRKLWNQRQPDNQLTFADCME